MANNIFAGFSIIQEDDVLIDINSFIRRFLLFDQYIIQTIRLKDISQLVVNFGVNGLIELLESGYIQIHCDALTTAQTGQSILYTDRGKEPLPYGSYSFHDINVSDRRWYISDCLRHVHETVPNLKDAIRLKKAIVGAIVLPPLESGIDVHDGFSQALEQNRTLVKQACLHSFKQFDLKVDERLFEIQIDKIGESEFRTNTNLGSIAKLPPEAIHKSIERGLLTVSGFYQRLGYMKYFDAISWMQDSELALLDEDLKHYNFEITSNNLEGNYTKVVEIGGLPVVAPDYKFNATALIRLRHSRECTEFRNWIKSVDGLNEFDIEDVLSSFRSAASTVLGSRTGKVLRFGLSSIVGAVAQNPIAGVAISAIDEFLIEAYIKKHGPTIFINNKLPKLYETS